MTKHTAVPWESTASMPEDGFECFFIHAGEGYSQRQIATVDGPQDEKGEANARLIAAAPELLDQLTIARLELHACQAVMHLSGYGFDPAYVDDAKAALKTIDAAIAKATGEQA